MDPISTKQGYFSPTASTPDTTAPSTPITDEAKMGLDDLKKDHKQFLPALMRDYPQPEGEINVEEALRRQPGRWTFVGQMEANRARTPQRDPSNNTRNAAKQELDAIKADLLESHQKFQIR